MEQFKKNRKASWLQISKGDLAITSIRKQQQVFCDIPEVDQELAYLWSALVERRKRIDDEVLTHERSISELRDTREEVEQAATAIVVLALQKRAVLEAVEFGALPESEPTLPLRLAAA